MKYRTAKYRRTSLATVAAICIGLIAVTSTASWAALKESKDAQQKIATELAIASATPTQAASASPTPSASPTSSVGVGETNGGNAAPGLWVTGDSVILGIRAKLEAHYPIALINARVGRQIQELIQVVTADQADHATLLRHSTVVLDLGNNNHLTESDVRMLFALLKDQPEIIVVDTAVPRAWKDDNNRIIKKVLVDYPQAKLVDWDQISMNHPEYFAPDGVHLDEAGAQVYVGAIIEALTKS